LQKGTGLGANAVAVPGRLIVVTDQLVDALGKSPRLDAIVAHEVGHLHHRHVLEALLREAGLSVVVGAVVQDAGLQQAVVEALPRVLLRAAHPREAERRADEFAVLALSRSGRSRADLATVLEKMEAIRPKKDGRSQNRDTHPATPEWINPARAQR
jgi:predicted Zn-dependent protease